MDKRFRQLWVAQAISQLGSQISAFAVPMAAIVLLHATPVQMGWLTALSSVPRVLFAVVLGVVVDRFERKTILVAANIVQGAILAVIPVAYVLGRLTLQTLYAVTFLTGICAIAFVLAYHAILPMIVDRGELVEANGKLSLVASIAAVVGPGIAGAVVGRFSAAVAVTLDSCSFVVSAWCIGRICIPAPATLRASTRLRDDLREGVRGLRKLPLLRSAMLGIGVGSFLGSWLGAVRLLFYVRELGLGANVLGGVLAVGALGSVAGGVLVRRATAQLGFGSVITVALGAGALVQVALSLLNGPLILVAVTVAAGEGLRGAATVAFLTSSTSLRQTLTPDHLQGRVGGLTRFTMAVFNFSGAVLGGAMGSIVGVRWAVFGGAAAMLVFALVLVVTKAAVRWNTIGHTPAGATGVR